MQTDPRVCTHYYFYPGNESDILVPAKQRVVCTEQKKY